MRETPTAGTSFVFHAATADQACQSLEVQPSVGLGPDEVTQRRERCGPNALPEPPPPSQLLRFLRQFQDPLVGALLLAAIIAALVAVYDPSHAQAGTLARFGDTAAILLIVVLNAFLGFFQELRAEKTLDALRRIATPTARVLREGEIDEHPARELVPGDVIHLEAGAAVPADLRILESDHLTVDEATLTGESEPVKKDGARVLPLDTPIADRCNMAFMGTFVAGGQARCVVTATGRHTELGRIGAMIEAAGRVETPLEQRIGRLGRIILFACLALSALLFVVGVVRDMGSIPFLLLLAVSLAVAAIPEGLPAITTITLALGMHRMAKRGAIIRRLPAVETLGSATVICTDKTGTVTENRMRVRAVQRLDESWDTTQPGALRDKEGPLAKVQALLETAVLANAATLRVTDAEPEQKSSGDPTDVALLVLAHEAGLDRDALSRAHPVVKTLPFDSQRKLMAVLTEPATGRRVWHIKGSPEVLLPRASRVDTGEGIRDMDDAIERKLVAHTEALADRGLRVLALARREEPPDDAQAAVGGDLTLLGLVAMHDPPRREVREAIRSCHTAGIRVAMITGDHPRTAVAIARELELWTDESQAMTGQELADLTDEALRDRVDRIAVFARVAPEQKLRIVRSLKARGHVVAMTGDGVNDAPALKEAQIGVAMGGQGTEVARQAADMVIADDNFATIVHAVREGRAIFSNIHKFVFFLNSSNAGLVTAVIVSAFFDALPQLTPLQLLWINLVTNGLPALALGVDPPDPRNMTRPPRSPDKGLFGLRDGVGVIFVGFLMGMTALLVAALPSLEADLITSAGPRHAHDVARTMAFTLLAIAPLFHALNARSARESVFRVGLFKNRKLWGACLLSAAIHFVAVGVPTLHPVFKTVWLNAHQWLTVIALAALLIPAVEVAKWFERRYGQYRA